jgi:hypothetical protein
MHVGVAHILLHYNDPSSTLLREFYAVHHDLTPTLIAYPVLTALQAVGSAQTSEKVLVSLFLLLLPAAFLYCLRGLTNASRDRGEIMIPPFLLLPMLYNYVLFLGFYNYAMSLIPFFLAIGYWVRCRNTHSPGRLLGLSLLSLMLYFSHIVSFLAACIVVTLLAPALAWEDDPGFRRRTIGSWCAALLAFLPGLALAGQYFVRAGVGANSPKPLLWKMEALLAGGPILVLDRATIPLGIALAGLLGALSGIVIIRKCRFGGWRGRDGLLLVIAAFMALYFVLPDGASGGGAITQRMNLTLFLLVVLWLESQDGLGRLRSFAYGAAVVITLGLVVVQGHKLHELQECYAEYFAVVPRIEAGHTVISLIDYGDERQKERAERIAWRCEPFIHAGGAISAQRNVVAMDDLLGRVLFPVQFRLGLNPERYMKSGRKMSITAYERETGRTIDYVLLWQPFPEVSADEGSIRLLEDIESGYTLVASSPKHQARLFRRHESSGEPH